MKVIYKQKLDWSEFEDIVRENPQYLLVRQCKFFNVPPEIKDEVALGKVLDELGLKDSLFKNNEFHMGGKDNCACGNHNK